MISVNNYYDRGSASLLRCLSQNHLAPYCEMCLKASIGLTSHRACTVADESRTVVCLDFAGTDPDGTCGEEKETSRASEPTWVTGCYIRADFMTQNSSKVPPRRSRTSRRQCLPPASLFGTRVLSCGNTAAPHPYKIHTLRVFRHWKYGRVMDD